MTERALKALIEGVVQGVGFRAFVAREAAARGLRGYVRNLRDGRVEAAFAGPAGAVEEMSGLCARGPAAARVAACQIVEMDTHEAASLPPFEIGRSG